MKEVMKPSIDQQLITVIEILKIDWQQPEENAGAFTTGLNDFDGIGPGNGDAAVREWVETNRQCITEHDWSDYEFEHFDERAFIQGFWWAAQRWLKHVEDNCDCPCRFCRPSSIEPYDGKYPRLFLAILRKEVTKCLGK